MASFASLKSQVFDREDRKQFIRTEEDEMDTSWEQRLVNNSYFEAGEHKQALVKLVVCEGCAEKLHYKRDREQAEIRQKEEVNRNRELTGIEDDMGDEQRKSIDRKRTDSGMEREDSRGRREKKIKSREGK
ncbi:uncharacterized protein LOC141657586 isoform X1 [Silene latifolia]|uniref:uncharacterized protein LOC141657586 isoform X1 n=1 Tax=Silene latifolia TaxID=37657 RepID=UPI003D76F3A7